jgi:ribosomal-protein-alanine N-acetyltransferase
MRTPPSLAFPGFSVRLAELEEASAVARYYASNLEHLRHSMPTPPTGFLTEAWWQQRIRSNWEEFAEGTSVRCFLFEGEQVVGHASLSAVQRGPLQACYLGYAVAAHREGRGWMSRAVGGLVRYAFDDLGLHRIMANHLPDNLRSARLLARLGFEREGLARDYLYLDGAWRDHVLNARRNPDWRPTP